MIFIKVGLIDSGLGAISVLNNLIKQKKYCEYILYLDYLFAPLGNKNEIILLERLNKAIGFLKKKKCDLIVIACNTLSAIAIKFNIQNVILPIYYFKKIIDNNFDNDSILLATKYTSKSNIYDVLTIECNNLASYIEGTSNKYLENIPYKKLFFGCTHYGLITHKFKNKKIYDSGEVLADNLSFKNSKLKINLYVTKINSNIQNHLIYHLHINEYSINLIKN